MERISRERLRTEVARFGIDFSDRMLQYALRGIGITPAYEGVPGGRGKVSRHDPIDAWVIASAEFGRAGSWTDESVSLKRLTGLYEWVREAEGAADIPGFLEDEVFGKKLLYIARWENGFPLDKLYECLQKDPKLYELNAYGPGFMRNFLMSYKGVFGKTLGGRPLPSEDDVFVEDSEKMGRYFAQDLVSWAGDLFRINASPAPEFPDGGEA